MQRARFGLDRLHDARHAVYRWAVYIGSAVLAGYLLAKVTT